MNPIDARLIDAKDATIDDLRDEIKQLERELDIAERKAMRWKEAFDEVEKIVHKMLADRRGTNTS